MKAQGRHRAVSRDKELADAEETQADHKREEELKKADGVGADEGSDLDVDGYGAPDGRAPDENDQGYMNEVDGQAATKQMFDSGF